MHMKIVLYYDYICPFCSLATERIVSVAEEFALETAWLGIEIHPEHPPEGTRRKKTEKAFSVAHTLKTLADEADDDIKLPGFATNSRLCLEASEFAKRKNRFMEFHKACYRAYFREKRNIGLAETVIEVGREAGLGAEELSECLEKRTFSETIDRNIEKAREDLVLGVPTLYIGDLRVHGIQTTESYRKLVERKLARSIATH